MQNQFDSRGDIVIAGYPKSGNTWLVRLVAELVGCPVAGFLGRAGDDIATEGSDRKSNYRCYKSHHGIDFLRERGIEPAKVIYIIRDPRDVSLSAARYFTCGQYSWISHFVRLLPLRPRAKFSFYRSINSISPLNPESCIDRVVRAVVYGDETVHWFLRIPWRDHYLQYLSSGCLFVKYEDLVDFPFSVCQDILAHLGLSRDEDHILESIRRQSFSEKKHSFILSGDHVKAEFLKVGSTQQWKHQLDPRLNRFLLSHLKDDMARFGYSLSA